MKAALFALTLSLSALSPAFAAGEELDLLEEASGRLGCGGVRLESSDGRTCHVAFFPDRVGAKARFACGQDVFVCACTEEGASCYRR